MQAQQTDAGDRREHPRLALDHPGILTLAGARARACRLRDVCAGGLRPGLPRPAWSGRDTRPPPLVERGDAAVLRVAVGVAGKTPAFEIRLRVARVFEGGMGVAFVAPNPGVVRILQQLAARRSSPLAARPPDLMEAIRGAFRRALAEQLEPRLAAMLQDIDGPHAQAACTAACDGRQGHFIDAIPVLQNSRAAIVRDVIGGLLERIAEFGGRQATSPPTRTGRSPTPRSRWRIWTTSRTSWSSPGWSPSPRHASRRCV